MATVADAETVRAALEAVRRASDAPVAVAPEIEPTVNRLRTGPDPEGALLRACGLPAPVLASWPPPDALVDLLHQGGWPARLLARDPSAIAGLDGGPCPDPAAIAAELRERFAGGDVEPALGHVTSREYLRLAAREVGGAALEDVGGALCDLAAGCLEALLEHHGLAQTVVVFGMGKLGGHELNFLSDIDLVFVHDDATEDRAAIASMHDRLRKIIRALEGHGAFKPQFRVDLRLRPFGSRGPLSLSVSATEAYYERHGQPWERQVWVRAAPVAGNRELADILLRRLRPFVFRRSVTPAIFEEIDAMMQRARRTARRQTPGDTDDTIDLKHDAGTIREVEFTVQALQLLHGGRSPALRHPGTLVALHRLWAAGLVSDREHRELGDAYRFLRRVEHRVQLAEGRQTHTVPAAGPARAQLAARLGTDEPTLVATLQRHRDRVGAAAATIRPAGAAEVPPLVQQRRADRTVVLDPGAPAGARTEALRRLGVRDPEEIDALLAHLYARRDGALTARGATQRGAQRLVAACLDSTDPDAAVRRLLDFAAVRPPHYAVWRFLDDAADDVVRVLAELLAASEALSRGIVGFPSARGSAPDDTVALLQAAMSQELPDGPALARAWEAHPHDRRGLDATLLRFKHQALVAIGICDLGRRPDPLAVGSALSDLADLVLRTILRDVAAAPRHRAPPRPFDLAVMAVGKYGMQAMDYGSDLDLVLVFDPLDGEPPADLHDAAIAVARAAVARLSDRTLGQRLYEIDLRLRPSGRAGLLVTSLEGFRRYHAGSLPVWEKLALLRMRAVAQVRVGEHPGGDAMASAWPGSLSTNAVPEIVARSLWGQPIEPSTVAQQVRSLKTRIESELARETRGVLHAKAGRGACLELELLVSALQLRHGAEAPPLRARSVVGALSALAAAGVLGSEDARALSATYRFQRRLLNRLRMDAGSATADVDRFAENSPRLVTLARRMGLASRDALLEAYRASREMVRSAFDHHLPP